MKLDANLSPVQIPADSGPPDQSKYQAKVSSRFTATTDSKRQSDLRSAMLSGLPLIVRRYWTRAISRTIVKPMKVRYGGLKTQGRQLLRGLVELLDEEAKKFRIRNLRTMGIKAQRLETARGASRKIDVKMGAR